VRERSVANTAPVRAANASVTAKTFLEKFMALEV
jgi:hypothetical protein